jgi:hypothetical protein
MTTHERRQVAGAAGDDPAAPLARDPRREAQELLGHGLDARVPEPYLYALPQQFDAAPPDGYWNATSSCGAILPLGALLDADDQRAAALAYLRRGRALLEP